MSGYPMRAASFASCSSPSTTPSLPGIVGRPAVFTSRRFDYFRPRPDEGNFRCFADLGEVGVFGEEPVTRVNGIHIRNFGGADHLGDIQIAFAAACRPDANRLIRKSNMEGITVRFGIDRNRGYAQLIAGADDPQGDFPAIGN